VSGFERLGPISNAFFPPSVGPEPAPTSRGRCRSVDIEGPPVSRDDPPPGAPGAAAPALSMEDWQKGNDPSRPEGGAVPGAYRLPLALPHSAHIKHKHPTSGSDEGFFVW